MNLNIWGDFQICISVPLKHLEMVEETWFSMPEDEHQKYTDMVFKTKLEEVEFVKCERKEIFK